MWPADLAEVQGRATLALAPARPPRLPRHRLVGPMASIATSLVVRLCWLRIARAAATELVVLSLVAGDPGDVVVSLAPATASGSVLVAG